MIAYSTCSQLGYMFFAAGVGAYQAAMFHLFTHAFFKALLFLGAGSVIHGMHHEQDMRRMGGLWRYLPVTYAVMTIGTLAITGFGGQLAITEAFRHGQASAVAPFEYSALAWGVMLDWFIWQALPEAHTWLGAAIIIGSGLWLVRHEQRITEAHANPDRV